MRPPICAVCHVRIVDDGEVGGGGLVTFADDARSIAFRARQQTEPGFVGHPPNLEWFCGDHVRAARALAHRSRSEALAALARGPTPPSTGG